MNPAQREQSLAMMIRMLCAPNAGRRTREHAVALLRKYDLLGSPLRAGSQPQDFGPTGEASAPERPAGELDLVAIARACRLPLLGMSEERAEEALGDFMRAALAAAERGVPVVAGAPEAPNGAIDALIERVEFRIGMGRGAWDMVDHRELVAAVAQECTPCPFGVGDRVQAANSNWPEATVTEVLAGGAFHWRFDAPHSIGPRYGTISEGVAYQPGAWKLVRRAGGADRAVLGELVALQDLQRERAKVDARWARSDYSDDAALARSGELCSELARRQPAAWEAARAVLAGEPWPVLDLVQALRSLRPLDAQPGASFVMTLQAAPTHLQVETLKRAWREVMGGARLLVLPPGATLAEQTPQWSPAEIDANPRLHVEPDAWERRADGRIVRKDRCEIGLRNIVTVLLGARTEFEVEEVVEAVRTLARGDGALLPMSRAPRKRAALLRFAQEIPGRPDMTELYAGRWIVGRNQGDSAAWSLAGPFGCGGFPDDWFDGWMPLPGDEAAARPLDIVTHCPNCHMQHIDRPDPEGGPWRNDPHRTHLCREEDGGCGTKWRPADVPTNGVAAIATRGSEDTWPPAEAAHG